MPTSKMFMIRNLETFHPNDEITSVEYEVTTNAHIVGEFKYGPYSLSTWDFGFFNEGEERKLCLRIKSSKVRNYKQPSTSRKAYYHGGNIADEIVSLSSLFLRRKLKLGTIVRKDDRPMRISNANKWIDKPLISGKSNLSSITEWFVLIESLDHKVHQKFILAVRLYHRAILLIEEEPDLAYLNLISAIEVLCQDVELNSITLNDIDSELAKLVNSLDDNIRDSIEKRIINRERFIKRKFVKFILDNIDENFWLEDRPKQGRVEQDKLEELLGRIYKQRSNTLHSGEPFPVTIYDSPVDNCEIEFFLGISVGEKKWEPQDFIPNPHFFERLVNYVLKNYLKKNSTVK